MGLKEMIQRMREKKQSRGETFRNIDTQQRAISTLEERQKSANQRELERFLKEEREVAIKDALEQVRKQKDLDVKFGHNPLNTKNIIYSDFNVLHSNHNMLRGSVLNERSNFFGNERRF